MLIRYGTRLGAFDAVNLPPVNGPGTWDFEYDAPPGTIGLYYNWPG